MMNNLSLSKCILKSARLRRSWPIAFCKQFLEDNIWNSNVKNMRLNLQVEVNSSEVPI